MPKIVNLDGQGQFPNSKNYDWFRLDNFISFSSVQFKMIYLYSHYQTHEVFIINKSGESTCYLKIADL